MTILVRAGHLSSAWAAAGTGVAVLLLTAASAVAYFALLGLPAPVVPGMGRQTWELALVALAIPVALLDWWRRLKSPPTEGGDVDRRSRGG